MKTYTRLVLAYAMLNFAVSNASAQEPDLYVPSREIIASLDKIATRNGAQETFVTTLGGAKQVVNVQGAAPTRS